MENKIDILETNSSTEEKYLRPKYLRDYIGQQDIKSVLEVYINAAKKREETPDHLLFYGPPGLGKTTLAEIVANEMGVKIKQTSGPVLEKQRDIITLLSSLEPGDVLFIDEIHRLPKVVEEILYSAMEDYAIDVVIDRNDEARSIRIDLSPFTLIGATTRFGELSSPLRDRFGITFRLDYYDDFEIKKIIERTASIYDFKIENKFSTDIAKRSRKTPRIANKLFLRVRDFAEVKNNGVLNEEILTLAFNLLKINENGLDQGDILYLEKLIKLYNGGPVGIEAMSIAMGEAQVTISDVYEPFLIKEGYIKYTKRGRIALDKAYEQIGVSKE